MSALKESPDLFQPAPEIISSSFQKRPNPACTQPPILPGLGIGFDY